jgi:4-amino-4-deoxy-L-arabinose transferase-like glycosyltransferase
VTRILGQTWVQHALVLGAVAALLLPNADMGLYDPWETHYAETARRIGLDGDWITLRWHADSRLADDVNRRCRADPGECHFFSKPVLIFWLMALSFQALGVSDAAARLPILLIGLFGVFGVYWYVRRMLGLLPGLLSAAVLATTPYYYLLSRQIMTDIAFVVPMTVGLLALAWWLLYPDEARPRHLYLFYVMAGLATLAKGLLGFLLPGAVALAFMLLSPGRFVERLKRLQVERGGLVFLSVAAPWYAAVYAVNGNTWFQEFIIKHHFRRVGSGVHGERGTFEYFVEQLGYGMWPWIALVPLALGTLWLASRSRQLRQGEKLTSFLLVWAAVAFTLFTITTTKFHHYVFPAVPPMAMLVGISLARLWHDRPGALEKAALLFGAGVLAVVTSVLLREPWRFINLFIYKYDRHYPDIPGSEAFLAVAAGVFTVGLLLVFLPRASKAAAALLCAGAAVAAGWNVQGFLIGHDPTISQRDAFAAYDRLRQPGDRLYEWALRWRGEVWYSRDDSHEIDQQSLSALRRELGRPGRAFIVTTSPGPLNERVQRAFGRGVEVVNGNPVRYAMTLWEGPPEGSADEAIVESVPSRATAVNARLGDGVELLAYELRPARLRPGSTVTLVLYFRTTERLRGEWTVFVHGDLPGGERRHRLLSDHPPAYGWVPTPRWRPGQIIRDETQIETDDDQPPGTYHFHAGLFDDSGRMPVHEGPSDGESRVELGTITIE